MSTASKFAQEFSLLHLETDKTVGSSRLTANLDQSLAPVRECLEGLRNSHGCWCPGSEEYEFKSPFVCGPSCLAAQQLWERLKIQ